MIISLDMSSDIPIYVQLRNQIVTGIGKGELKAGESLPSVRQMARDAGINSMTVNKTYQILKTEGFIEIDRRKGATVRPVQKTEGRFREKLEAELEILSAEACIKGMPKEEFLRICEEIIVPICWFSYGNQSEYREGMVMGVHIPAHAVEDPEVTRICGRTQKQWKRFHQISLLLSMLICFLCFYNFTLFIIVWSVWLTGYVAGLYWLIVVPHRQMYRLKLKRSGGWICCRNKRIRLGQERTFSFLSLLFYAIIGRGGWSWRNTENKYRQEEGSCPIM